MHVLFVCIGNICRSPIAEGILKEKARLAGLPWLIESCGVEDYHIGKPPHKYSQKVCLQHGVDISGQKARRFRKEDFGRFDKIYALAADVLDTLQLHLPDPSYKDKLDLFLNELHPGKDLSVPDPWYGDESGYFPVYQMIEQGCSAIIERYGRVPFL